MIDVKSLDRTDLYLDTEFKLLAEDGRVQMELLAIGIVVLRAQGFSSDVAPDMPAVMWSEDEYYAENEDAWKMTPNAFVKDHVLDSLRGGDCRRRIWEIADDVKKLIEESPGPVTIYTDCGAFDFAMLMSLFGLRTGYDWPDGIPYTHKDLNFDFKRLEIEALYDNSHNALNDARALRKMHSAVLEKLGPLSTSSDDLDRDIAKEMRRIARELTPDDCLPPVVSIYAAPSYPYQNPRIGSGALTTDTITLSTSRGAEPAGTAKAPTGIGRVGHFYGPMTEKDTQMADLALQIVRGASPSEALAAVGLRGTPKANKPTNGKD